MPDEEVAPVTLTCPEPGCNKGPDGGVWEVTGPATGAGSASWKLGTHRARAHGYVSERKRGRPRTPPSTPRGNDGGARVVDVVRDAAAQVSDRSTKPPTVEELTRSLTLFVGTMSTAEASYFAETDPTALTEADRDAVVEYLRLSPSDAREVAYPFARVLGRSKLNARYGRALVDNLDMGAAGAALFSLGVRHRRYFRERRRREEQLGLRPGPYAAPTIPAAPAPPPSGPAPMAAPVPTGGPPPASPNGFAPPGGTTQPGEMRGLVASGPPPEVADALARANGQHVTEVPGGA